MNHYKLSKAGVSANEGIARFNGDKEMYEQVLNSFPNDNQFAQLCAALAAKDVKAAFSAAHSLKGVAGNLSMTQLFEDIQPLVETLRAGSLEQTDALLVPVARDYEAVLAALR